ncbi:hypothetical protein ACFYW8_04110 [Streptomyces sp. NPDC002742]|uniref:hypothetical protein n=1 Tax=Streptomyces sp. NPDC002742 TaxID=3364663 RepID=UPI0036827258
MPVPAVPYEGEYRGDTGVRSGEVRGPGVTGPGSEPLGEPFPQYGPAAVVVLGGQPGGAEPLGDT